MEHSQAGRTEAMTSPEDLRKMAVGHMKGFWGSMWKEVQRGESKEGSTKGSTWMGAQQGAHEGAQRMECRRECSEGLTGRQHSGSTAGSSMICSWARKCAEKTGCEGGRQ